MEGHLRGIIGQLTVEEIVKQPEMVGDRMRATCADDMNKMGLEVISFTIKEVRDKNEYITNMGRPDMARIKRDADVAAAEAERDTAIKRAEASAPPPLPRLRPIRNACWQKRCHKQSRPRRSAISRSRRRIIRKSPRSRKHQADKAYEIQNNIMQQQVIAEQVKIRAGGEGPRRSRCRMLKSSATNEN